MKHVYMAYSIHMYGAGLIMIKNNVYADYSNNKGSSVEQMI